MRRPGRGGESQPQDGKYKKVSVTDPDATMATTARNRRLEPAYKQHAVDDDVRGVIRRGDDRRAQRGAGRGRAHRCDHGDDRPADHDGDRRCRVRVCQGLGGPRAIGIDALIPTKAEPIRSAVPLRRFRYDAKNDVVKCSRGKILQPALPIKHGRFFYSREGLCACPLAKACLSRGRLNKAVVIRDHYPALLRARRRRERWSAEDRRIYQPPLAVRRLPR